MAIQPIDLQTLYTQMDKVSKNVAYQEKGVYLNREVNQADQQKKIDEQRKAIEKTRKEETQSDRVKDRNGNPQQQNQSADDEQEKQEDSGEKQSEVVYDWIRDPALGNHIDISG